MAVGPIVAGAAKGAKVAAKFVGQMKQRGKKAMNWFKDTVKKVEKAAAPGKYGRKELLSDEGNLGIVDTPDIGRMYLFQYDPKWKSKLPWYDVWPLISHLTIETMVSWESIYITFPSISEQS